MCPPAAEAPCSDPVMLESTLTKTPVGVDRENLAWPRTTEWDTTAAGFQLGTKASVSPRVLEPEMSLLSGLRMHPVIDLFLSACFIDVCLVLQSDRNFGNAHRLQNILLYTVLCKLVMKKCFLFFSFLCH